MASLAAETQGVGMFEYVELNKNVSEHVTTLDIYLDNQNDGHVQASFRHRSM